MSHTGPSKAMASSLNKLQISSNIGTSAKSRKSQPADSWEDEADENTSDTDMGATTPKRPGSSDVPRPPPPTPSSPMAQRSQGSWEQSFEAPWSTTSVSTNTDSAERRPDKSTAVAARLIAAGIGQKAPKRSQEQREYDQAMKVQEKKKRDQVKEEEERRKQEKEKAQKAIWGD